MFSFFQKSFFNSKIYEIILQGDDALDDFINYIKKHTIKLNKKFRGVYLLEATCLFNDSRGMTPRVKMVRYLFSEGADPKIIPTLKIRLQKYSHLNSRYADLYNSFIF